MDQPSAVWMPSWARSAIFYHIYPLGFLDAPHQNPGGEVVHRLPALSGWLDHIALLGCNAIYLGPIFESISHGYDTTDYFRIDRRLGDEADFRAFIEHAHLRGMRVVLDGVFNHTGRDFFAFRDLREKGPASRYADWYHVDWTKRSRSGDPFAYRGWEGHEHLPRLNHSNPQVRDYIFEVARMWLKDNNIDGWRLDAIEEIPVDFVWALRRECKSARPDALLLAETVHGDFRTYVDEDLCDTGTNYQFYDPLWQALSSQDLTVLDSAFARIFDAEVGLYRHLMLMNFIGNHDVERIASRLDNPAQVFLALLLMMTVPGIPSLYYGDEIGLKGKKQNGGDWNLRPPMPPREDWPDQRGALYEATARLATLRRRTPALREGLYLPIDSAADCLAFLREARSQKAIVVVNARAGAQRIELNLREHGFGEGAGFVDMLDPKHPRFYVRDGKLNLPSVWGNWGHVLVDQPL